MAVKLAYTASPVLVAHRRSTGSPAWRSGV